MNPCQYERLLFMTQMLNLVYSGCKYGKDWNDGRGLLGGFNQLEDAIAAYGDGTLFNMSDPKTAEYFNFAKKLEYVRAGLFTYKLFLQQIRECTESAMMKSDFITKVASCSPKQ